VTGGEQTGGVVSVTQATGTGAVYTLDEIGTFGSIAEEARLCLHMDGARFGGSVASLGCTPAELTWLGRR
jgi:threonine aldolase